MLWDPQAHYTITAAAQAMNTDYSIFEGFEVKGSAHKVFSRGLLAVDNGNFTGQARRRQFVRRNIGEVLSA